MDWRPNGAEAKISKGLPHPAARRYRQGRAQFVAVRCTYRRRRLGANKNICVCECFCFFVLFPLFDCILPTRMLSYRLRRKGPPGRPSNPAPTAIKSKNICVFYYFGRSKTPSEAPPRGPESTPRAQKGGPRAIPNDSRVCQNSTNR